MLRSTQDQCHRRRRPKRWRLWRIRQLLPVWTRSFFQLPFSSTITRATLVKTPSVHSLVALSIDPNKWTLLIAFGFIVCVRTLRSCWRTCQLKKFICLLSPKVVNDVKSVSSLLWTLLPIIENRITVKVNHSALNKLPICFTFVAEILNFLSMKISL